MVVARRYRPQNFDELVGQEQSSQALRNAITTNRVGHAYLFTGARGVGKTSTARIFGKALNCVTGPTTHPCNQCDICRGITTGEDVDVIEIDGASNRGIDEIRQLRSNVSVRPSRARFKIYIIDEVHMLTPPAFNALLKTLEEPPEHVKFIFCTTDPEKIPITVLSRCQRYDFPPVETSAILSRLREIVKTEGVSADEEALQILARRAGGSMRDSQSLLEQLLSFCGGSISVGDVHRLLGTAPSSRLRELSGHLLSRNIAEALRAIDVAIGEGVDPGQLCEQLLGYYRDLMVAASGGTSELMLHTSTAEFSGVQALATQIGLETILATVQILDHTLTRFKQSTHVRILVEIALVRICSLEDLSQLSALVSGLMTGQVSPPASGRPSTVAQLDDNQKKKDELAPSSATEPFGAASGPALPVTQVGRIEASSSSQTLQAESVAAATPQSTKHELLRAEAENSAVTCEPPDRDDVDDAGSSNVTLAVQACQPMDEPRTSNVVFVDTADVPSNSSSDVTPAGDPKRIWSDALTSLGDMTTSAGQMATRVNFEGDGRLSVVFPATCSLQKEICERRRSRLEEAIAGVAGRVLRLDMVLSAVETRPRDVVVPTVTNRQLMRDVQRAPFVARALELFEGEVIRVEERRAIVQVESVEGLK